jgi:hypothetical protein
MVDRGANHTKALSVTATHLARRLWRTLERATPYVICDVDGQPLSKEDARAVIAEHWTVPEDVRQRRRSKKKPGKAPHNVLAGHSNNGAHRASTRRPSPKAIFCPNPT